VIVRNASQHPVRVLALAVLVATTVACGWNEDRTASPTQTETNTIPGQFLTAKIGADSFTAQTGYAYLSSADGRMVFQAYAGQSTTPISIQLHVKNAAVGTFDLGEPFGSGGTDGWLFIGLSESAVWYTRKAGDGSLTITSLTETTVEGTFRFDGTGVPTANPPLQRISEGKFKLRVCATGQTIC
jgi:hypothetical protein